MLAMLSRDFSHALEESLDIWIRNNPSATWEDLIKSVELLELATADRLRHAVHTKRKYQYHSVLCAISVSISCSIV